MYLSPLGAGTRVQLIIRPVIVIHKVSGFIAELANKINLSVIIPGQIAILSWLPNQSNLEARVTFSPQKNQFSAPVSPKRRH
jgi:hypothetical protein